MIRIVWFIACMGRWRQVILQELLCLRNSGLFDAADEILVCQAGKGNLGLPDKCNVAKKSDVGAFEFPALELLRETARPGDKILYMHTKGVSRRGATFKVGNQWREYLLWGCVERWREHAQALDFCDISGVQLTQLDNEFTTKCGHPRVFAGNFWWTRGDWAMNLPSPPHYRDADERWKAEGWIFFVEHPRLFELHSLTSGKLITPTYPFRENFSRAVYDPTPTEKINIVPRMIERRWEIINEIANHFGHNRYLEIGLFLGNNFKHIICEWKESVDPNASTHPTHAMTSDEFFGQTQDEWDLIFVDGLHTEEQVLKDIDNALLHLAEGGTIIVHDCNPETENEQRDLSAYDQKGVWVGMVWRGFARLRMTRPDLYMAMIDADFGCGVIRRGRQECFPENELSFPFFVQNRKALMNTIEPEDFWKWLDTLR